MMMVIMETSCLVMPSCLELVRRDLRLLISMLLGVIGMLMNFNISFVKG